MLITRIKTMLRGHSPKETDWEPQPGLKVCVTTGLTKKEIEKAGITIRHAVTKVLKQRRG